MKHIMTLPLHAKETAPRKIVYHKSKLSAELAEKESGQQLAKSGPGTSPKPHELEPCREEDEQNNRLAMEWVGNYSVNKEDCINCDHMRNILKTSPQNFF
jgi:hypothetical protein